MNWTKETPTYPGFYWCRQNNTTRMVKVWRYTYSTNKTLFTNEDGGSEVTDKELYSNAQWYGPIEPPKENE